MANMTNHPKCRKNGYLVGTELRLPADPKIYYENKDEPLIGCNRIWCDRCHHFVRSWAGYCIKDRLKGKELAQDQLKRLYTTDNPNLLPFLSSELCSRSRVYACTCHAEEVSGVYNLTRGLWIMDYYDFEYWGCAGHPQT